MKATFSRQALMSGIGLIQNVGSTATTLPILANILFDANAKGVNLVATDLECFARVYLETEVEEAGRVAVPAKTLADIVRLLPDDTVAVVTSGTRMTLTCGRNVYHLTTMNAEDFPDWPSMESSNKLTLKQSDFGKLLRNTLFAMPTRDPRKVLMGALFEVGDKTLTCVATDGRKLGRSHIELIAQEGSKNLSAIVPGRLLNEIERAIGEEGEIEITFSDQRAVFTLSNLNLTYLTSLIEGKFPQHDAVIPKSFKKTLELPKSVVTDAIGRAAILAERKHHSIVMSFKKNSLNVTSQSFEDGSYQGDIDLDYDGEPFKVAFNYHYLNDVFRVAPDAILRMKVKESSAPIVFECESDLNSIYLVMPVRIHDLKGAEEGAEEGGEEE